MTDPSAPEIACTHEVRFAVVMYGGVSLAIYINGIAQELLSLVRSTAAAYEENGNRVALSGVPITGFDDLDKEKKLKGTERVYRKLSYLLSKQGLMNDYREFLKPQPSKKAEVIGNQKSDKEPATKKEDIGKKLDKMLAENKESINTRFVVDIMSGTSAGGINAIYLAKALANDQKIDQLKDLWLNEGDIALLINDKKSVTGLHMANQHPPQSLLNSRRM